MAYDRRQKKMTNICSVYWDDGVDKPSYIFLPNGITICSDGTRQGWIENFLALIDCYNIFASKYGKSLIAEEKHRGISALDGMQSGSIRIIAGDNTDVCWEMDDKGISRLSINGEPSSDNKFHIPQVQVASMIDAILDYGNEIVSFNDGADTIILDCTRINNYGELADIIFATWTNRKSGNQILVLVAAGNVGNLLYDNLYNQLGGNRVGRYNGDKEEDKC